MYNSFKYANRSRRKKTLDLVKSFREKLPDKSLEEWHKKHASNICDYDYFMRQINNLDLIRDDTVSVIYRYENA